MARDPRYDILFEPLRIGPVTAKNRFYQVPHCTGMGWMRPETLAAMRGVKAEGGWGVVCTEFNSIHPASDDLPYISASLWDDRDVRAHALMCEKVHAHGALAGAELWFGGARSPNHFSREVPMDLKSFPNFAGNPMQTRAMDKADIADFRRWHRKAALRARDAGFDIVYVYATHGYLLSNFLNPRMNDRADEYGGSLENRTRLVREVIEETKEAVGDRCAVAVRFSADEAIGEDGRPIHGERREMFEMLAEMPDLWDINIADYSLEMGASRFVKEGALEPYLGFIKSVTTKPVVTVGRFTSPDTMASWIRRGIVDLIGAARPSIADPFLPKKVEEGRVEDIRECIGCNICYTGDSLGVPIRCTQNPTMGEEWRKGWHPEHVAPARRPGERVLVVGAGPAGLEAARTLGARGFEVMLAEAGRTLGGRVTREASLPGMGEYVRVRDYREGQLARMPNVEIFRESELAAADVHEVGADHVVIATGAAWRRERFDGSNFVPVATGQAAEAVFTPDDIMDGTVPPGPAVVYDEDGYCMGVSVAERLHEAGIEVTYVTPEDSVGSWARHTGERWRMRGRLVELGIGIVTAHALEAFDGEGARLSCAYSGHGRVVPAASVVLVTQRAPRDGLYRALLDGVGPEGTLPFTLCRIGDCDAPSIVAAAVYAGHRCGRELGEIANPDNPLRHERAATGVIDTGRGGPEGYGETLGLYYEEEIMGAAYFDALTERFPGPEEREKLRLLAEVEVAAARSVRPLLDKHFLTPRPVAELRELGRAEALEEPGTWSVLMAKLAASFPDFIPAFERLEAMAPEEDRAALAHLTEHEHATIRFLEAEAKGDPSGVEELRGYLAASGLQT